MIRAQNHLLYLYHLVYTLPSYFDIPLGLILDLRISCVSTILKTVATTIDNLSLMETHFIANMYVLLFV